MEYLLSRASTPATLLLTNSWRWIAQEDQPQHGDRILRRLEFGIGSKFVGSFPKTLFNLCLVSRHDAIRSPGGQDSRTYQMKFRGILHLAGIYLDSKNMQISSTGLLRISSSRFIWSSNFELEDEYVIW
jgi:hypothetical protein